MEFIHIVTHASPDREAHCSYNHVFILLCSYILWTHLYTCSHSFSLSLSLLPTLSVPFHALHPYFPSFPDCKCSSLHLALHGSRQGVRRRLFLILCSHLGNRYSTYPWAYCVQGHDTTGLTAMQENQKWGGTEGKHMLRTRKSLEVAAIISVLS